MSLTYGFYNSVDHDRVYDATQFSEIFNGIINDGVFQNIGDMFAVTPNEGMQVYVGSGRAWFNGTWTQNDNVYPVTVPASHQVYPRIDAIVLEVNQLSTVRENSIKVISGTPASIPEKPTLVDSTYIHQHALAYVTVLANSVAITASEIENVVGLSETPFVTGILQVNDVDYLYSQWDAAFNTWMTGEQSTFEDWFQHLHNELDENQAAHLQNEIDAITPITLSATLEAGETELTFSDVRILERSKVELYIESDEFINPTSRESGVGYVTYIFDEQETDLYCELVITP